ncbi:MAG: type I-U CRISPR-associated protein Csb2 [Microthrixaceae bacterium]
MFAIRVDLLTDRYYATAFNDRQRGEWPPHPGRLFSAMVATWADDEPPADDERQALLWLEEQPPPSLRCDHPDDVAQREVATHFVPINDVSLLRAQDKDYQRLQAAHDALAHAADDDNPKAVTKARSKLERAEATAVVASQREANKTGAPSGALQLLPDDRSKQPRTFPAVHPATPTVYFIWEQSEPTPDVAEAIDHLLGRVARLGHSSSLVAASVATDPPEATMTPTEGGTDAVRVPVTGLLDALEVAHQQHLGSAPRVLPNKVITYGSPVAVEQQPTLSPYEANGWVLLRVVAADPSGDEAPRRLSEVPLRHCLGWTRALRGAVLRHAPHEAAYLGGHATSGQRLREPHPAFIPLGFVGTPYADGRCRAFAVVTPRSISDARRSALDQAIERWREDAGLRLYTGRGGELHLEVVNPDDLPPSIRPQRWAQPSTGWATATPIVLDRFPKHLRSDNVERRTAAEEHVRDTIRRAVTLQGFPNPAGLEFQYPPPLRGSTSVRSFKAYRHGRNSRSRPLSVHATLRFDEPVAGPLIVGAGRHLGYGLCAPTGDDR